MHRAIRPALILLVALSGAAPQQAPPHPVIAGFERFGDTLDPAEAGRILIGELNCAACHAAHGIDGKRAPILGDAGNRLRPDWVRAWLADPHRVKPGTTMPRVALAADEVEALVHFLASLRPEQKPAKWSGAPKQSATELFNTVGCAACHKPQGATDHKGDKAVVPLIVAREKFRTAEAFAEFLFDPLRWRPSGRMPKMNLTRGEALALARFGVGGATREPDSPGETDAGLLYESFEGSWDHVPDFDALTPVATGISGKFDVGLCKRKDHVGLRFRGYVDVPRDGRFTFYTSSDDGSRLWIGNVLVVDNDGIHGGTEASGAIELKKGKHALTVEWFEAAGGEELEVRWEGPGLKKETIPPAALSHPPSGKLAVRRDAPAEHDFAPDPTLVAKGKQLFATKTCASCHSMKPEEKPSAPAAAPLASFVGKPFSCRAVNFALSPKQSQAISKAIEMLTAQVKPMAPEALARQRAHEKMLALNCYACHERGGRGGPEKGRSEHFVSTEATAGDEGRIPPRLGDVGAKLTKSWLQSVLNDGPKVRPYMLTRMPAFGAANVAHLVEDFAKADLAAETPPVDLDRKLVAAGRQLVGDKGMRCITCHTFKGNKSQGIQSMDLIHMPTRLRRDWFDRYMLNPLELRPGTRMPAFWSDGKSARQDILNGDTKAQLDAVWRYLSEGNGAQLPIGIGPEPILLAATDEAVIYRNFIQGAGARGIAVAYPERVNLAFDANQMRLALLWQGDFIDASKHWIGRGSGFQGPAGENVVTFANGVPLAVLADEKSAWPEQVGKDGRAVGCEFEGYDLDKKQRPTFLYSFGSVKVRDFFEAVDGMKLKRTISLEASPAPERLWFRAATGKGIGVRCEGASATVGTEVRVPVKFDGGKAILRLEYTW